MPPQFFFSLHFSENIGRHAARFAKTILRCRSVLPQNVPLCCTNLEKRAGMLFKYHVVYRHAHQKYFRYVPTHARAPFLFVRILYSVPSQDLRRHDAQISRTYGHLSALPFILFL